MVLRFGLLGTGHWAAQAQAPALAAHPDVRFVGVWGRNPDKAAELAGRHEGARAYDDVDALLADVDAVAVALPPDIQAELAVRAARAGRHLLLDKPLALDTDAADRVVEAVDAAGVASLIFFTRRYHRAIDEFLTDAARTGGWSGARATMFSSIFGPGNPYSGSQWRRDRGGLWDIGPHALSLILPVLGPVTRVSAMTGPHDSTYVLLAHAGGAVSTMALTLDAPQAARMEQFTFHGSGGVVEVPSLRGSAVDAFRTALDQLGTLVAGRDRRHPCDVRFGREVVGILAAAERSAREGHAVAP